MYKGHFQVLCGMSVRGGRRQSICHPALHMKIFKKLFFFNFVTSLYVVSVEILNNTKFARARDS